jgi:hypothetical protein
VRFCEKKDTSAIWCMGQKSYPRNMPWRLTDGGEDGLTRRLTALYGRLSPSQGHSTAAGRIRSTENTMTLSGIEHATLRLVV